MTSLGYASDADVDEPDEQEPEVIDYGDNKIRIDHRSEEETEADRSGDLWEDAYWRYS